MTQHEQTRAREPDVTGVTERDGVRTRLRGLRRGRHHGAADADLEHRPLAGLEGAGAYLARHYRVLTFDGRGCGRSGRPAGAAAYTNEQYAADTIAVMDATGDRRGRAGRALVRRGVLRCTSPPTTPTGCTGIFAIAPVLRVRARRTPTATRRSGTTGYDTHRRLGRSTTGTTGSSGDYDDFLEFFFAQMFNEPHSTKQIEDCVGWGREIEPATLVDATAGRTRAATARLRRRWSRCARG